MKNKVEQDTLINRLVAVPFYLKLLREKNTIEAEYETLRDNVEEGLFTEKERIIQLEAIVDAQRQTIKNQGQRIKELKANAKLQRTRKARPGKSKS